MRSTIWTCVYQKRKTGKWAIGPYFPILVKEAGIIGAKEV